MNQRRFRKRMAVPIVAAVAAFAGLVAVPSVGRTQQEGTIEGRVLDIRGQPAPGTEVRVPGLSRLARVGEDGRFSFRGVPPGRYVLSAFSEEHGAMSLEVEVDEGTGAAPVEVRLDPLYRVPEIFVSVAGGPVSENDLYQAAEVVGGRDLRSELEATLGETLAKNPGLSSSYFGPGSSRPVIRGLSSDRVRVLEAGVGTGDASTVSPDHAVSVEAQLADRIEIIRGPATLLYGSSAIGGVVNVFDNRVPDELPPSAVTGQLIAAGGTVADERNVSGELNGALRRIAWHASGLFRDTGDYRIPGHATIQREGHDEAGHGEEGIEGVLPNSALETARVAIGLSYVSSNGFIGASFSGYDTQYGVPPGAQGHADGEGEAPPSGDATEGEERLVSIDLGQRRVDVRGSWRFGSRLLRGLNIRFGMTDYRHTELEGGIPGTVFDNEEWEGRVEAHTQFGDRIHGAFGLHLGNRDFSASGGEAFTPPSDTDQIGLFTFQELDIDPVRFQVGGRLEMRDVTNFGDGLSREFDDVSLSGGISWSVTDRVGLAVSLSRSAKFPSVEELFSDGPHLATGSFEVGDPDLRTEAALGVDVTMRLDGERVRGQLSAFLTDFTDFIYQDFTGGELEALPVLAYTQADAVFRGVEGEVEFDLVDLGTSRVALEVSGDVVRAELSGESTPLPRIPPARVGAGLAFRGSPWDARIGVRRTAEQDRVSNNEELTEGYTMVDAQVAYRILWGETLHELMLQGRNLTDEEARNHISLIKEFAPLPGREFRLVYRLVF